MKLLFFGFILLALFSCQEKQVELTIEREKMIDIMVDIHIADEMISKFHKEDKDSVRNLYLGEISSIYDVDTSLIFKNIKILQSNPKFGMELYNEVYIKLEKQSNEFNKKKETEKKPKKEGEKETKKELK